MKFNFKVNRLFNSRGGTLPPYSIILKVMDYFRPGNFMVRDIALNVANFCNFKKIYSKNVQNQMSAISLTITFPGLKVYITLK